MLRESGNNCLVFSSGCVFTCMKCVRSLKNRSSFYIFEALMICLRGVFAEGAGEKKWSIWSLADILRLALQQSFCSSCPNRLCMTRNAPKCTVSFVFPRHAVCDIREEVVKVKAKVVTRRASFALRPSFTQMLRPPRFPRFVAIT